MSTFFIAGTDTEAGKTVVTELLLLGLAEQGKKTRGFKPIAAGCERTEAGLRNEDALAIQAAASTELPYEVVNPIALAEPIAPHIAAGNEQRDVHATAIVKHLRQWHHDHEVSLIEGAGGWLLPLNDVELMPQVVKELNARVILVVGLKLGCLNHALLTQEAIRASGCQLAGWVANSVSAEPMPYQAENIAYLQQHLAAPLLGHVPYHQRPASKATKIEVANTYLQLNKLVWD